VTCECNHRACWLPGSGGVACDGDEVQSRSRNLHVPVSTEAQRPDARGDVVLGMRSQGYARALHVAV
jgi:hypothetical protein